MKTAMQTLLEDIKFLMPDTYKALNKKFELDTFYLKMEKQQIIDARVKIILDSNYVEAEQYYNETFKK